MLQLSLVHSVLYTAVNAMAVSCLGKASIGFYLASYAKRVLGSRNSVCPSACLSVTRVLCD